MNVDMYERNISSHPHVHTYSYIHTYTFIHSQILQIEDIEKHTRTYGYTDIPTQNKRFTGKKVKTNQIR